ncbi:MAG: C40 family peptidase [Pyrinomonadaceae bacterium]
MKFEKFVRLAVCAVFMIAGAVEITTAQTRDRVVRPVSSRPINQPTVTPSLPARTQPLVSSRPVNQPVIAQPTNVERSAAGPTLTNEIVVQKPLVQKTGSASPLNVSTMLAGRATAYGNDVSSRMLQSITSKLGIPYLYGSTGPNRYDCSGFVWAVFRDAGIDFERSSARSLWQASVPVEGDERFKLGTLVFFNRLGHVGIVADKDGFYHASSSKGITYSKFEGYWANRIVGFRRLSPVPNELAIEESLAK